MNLTEILNSSSALGAAVIATLATLYKAIRTTLEFHDEYLRKRRFKYISYLTEESSEHTDLTEFIKMAKRESLFSAAFGRAASPRLAIAIMALYESKFFSLFELRSAFFYMNLSDSGAINVSPGKRGTFIFAIIMAFLLPMTIYIILLVYQLFILGSPVALLTAIFIIAVFSGFSFFLFRDAFEVIIAHRVGNRITAYVAGNLALPSNKISPPP